MKITAILASLMLASAAQAHEAGVKISGMTEDQKILYTFGMWLGQQSTPLSLTQPELKYVESGLEDYTQGKKPAVDPAVYAPKVNEFARTRLQTKADSEKKKAASFVAAAAKEKGAIKTASGLVFIKEREGKGPRPKATDKVRVNYEGRLFDGKVFDSSYARHTPAEFTLGGIIPCWNEGLQLMKVGGKAKLVCPSEIAYGVRGNPPTIPPGATLEFEVELLDIVK